MSLCQFVSFHRTTSCPEEDLGPPEPQRWRSANPVVTITDSQLHALSGGYPRDLPRKRSRPTWQRYVGSNGVDVNRKRLGTRALWETHCVAFGYRDVRNMATVPSPLSAGSGRNCALAKFDLRSLGGSSLGGGCIRLIASLFPDKVRNGAAMH